jgi:GMP synthase (glutamine-hydrolysing)
VKPFLLLATRAEDAAADEEYAAFLRFSGLTPEQLLRHRLEREPLGPVDLDGLSGIILGGSPFTASIPAHQKSASQVRAEAEIALLLEDVLSQDFPFLGACYGVGVLGSHLNGLVDDTFSEPVGPTYVELSEEGCEDPLLGVLPQRFEAFVGHKEAITRLPDDAVRLAGSEACPVQAFRIGQNVWATQFHPELDVRGICIRIDTYKHAGYFAPETADLLKERARASSVRHPPRLVSRFVELFART